MTAPVFPRRKPAQRLKSGPQNVDARRMARSEAVGTLERVSPDAARRYLGRRSALELVIFDAAVVAVGLWITLPAAVSLDGFWMQALVIVSPGLLLMARSLVIALRIPGVVTLSQLDPRVEIESVPALDEARHLAWLGVVVLGVTGAVAISVGAILGVAAAGALVV